MKPYMDMAGGNCIAESARFHWPELEQDLVVWWLQQAENQQGLRTTSGEHLIVLNTGILNDGPGPDILNCHLLLDDLELTGAVEMHLKARDWYGHKHDQDAHYHQVILHVVEEEEGGPDIPTLLVPRQQINRQLCLSRRSVSSVELLGCARLRFERKAEHLRVLSETSCSMSPLLLGMVEIILAGAQRHKRLQEVALRLGLSTWPANRVWQGSYQSFPQRHSVSRLLENILAQPVLFAETRWESLPAMTWSDWDRNLTALFQLGISRNQGREWIVNILAPFHETKRGFALWETMAVFRHYGLEKRLAINLGINPVKRIAFQQGLLEWQKIYCQPVACSTCPLTRSHYTLAQLN